MGRAVGAAYLLDRRAGIVLTLVAALMCSVAGARAQQEPPTTLTPPNYADPAVGLDPDAQRRADQIRKEQYKSDTIGQGGNLNLDIGKFVTEPDPIERSMPDVQEDSYTGMRLRLPLKSGRE